MEASVSHNVPPHRAVHPGYLWLGFLGILAAWAVQFQVVYAAAPWTCETGHHGVLHWVSFFCILAVGGATFLSWKNWKAVGGGEPSDKEDGEVARVRLLSVLGMMSGVLFGLATIAQWLAIVLLDPCPAKG